MACGPYVARLRLVERVTGLELALSAWEILATIRGLLNLDRPGVPEAPSRERQMELWDVEEATTRPELRERAVRMVAEVRPEYPSDWPGTVHLGVGAQERSRSMRSATPTWTRRPLAGDRADEVDGRG